MYQGSEQAGVREPVLQRSGGDVLAALEGLELVGRVALARRWEAQIVRVLPTGLQAQNEVAVTHLELPLETRQVRCPSGPMSFSSAPTDTGQKRSVTVNSIVG